MAHANVSHIFLSIPEVYRPQSLVSSNMSQLDLCGFSLLRAPSLKVVQLANRTPTLHNTKGHGFSRLSQLMKTISLQPTVILKKKGEGGRLLNISFAQPQGLLKCFVFSYYNYNLPGVEEMMGDGSQFQYVSNTAHLRRHPRTQWTTQKH